jgi:RimJ/RimL family protein N-acetyltransferase
MNIKASISQVALRDLRESDIPLILGYWYHSPPGYIASMGVDVSKMPSEDEMRKSLRNKVKTNRRLLHSKLNALVILVNREPIGFHTLTSIKEGDSGIFHAHIWKKELRGQGIGLQSYPEACRLFMERFDLQRIHFRTPAQNVGAIRVKEKLGIRCVGEETLDFDIIKKGTLGRIFELTRQECFSSWPSPSRREPAGL